MKCETNKPKHVLTQECQAREHATHLSMPSTEAGTSSMRFSRLKREIHHQRFKTKIKETSNSWKNISSRTFVY